MLKLIIGNKVYSSWSQRGWLAARQSGLPFEEVLVPIYDDAWEARKREPDLAPSNGKVPTLWDGAAVIWESLAIIDHLDERSGGTRFWPAADVAGGAARAMARSIASEMHAGYGALRRAHGMNLRHVYPAAPPSPEVQADMDRIMALWSEARARFGQGGDFLFGAFGAADIMFAPVITRFVTYALPVTDEARVYMDAMLAHPFMVQWHAAAMAEPWVIERFERPDLP